jgi:hypothetical protein
VNEAKESSICLDRPPSATSTSTSSSFRTSTDARSLSLSLPHQTTPRQPNPTHDRDFLKTAAADLKKKNPGFLLLVREGEGIQAAAHARYDGGREVAEGALSKLVEKGAKMPRTAESAGDLPGVGAK